MSILFALASLLFAGVNDLLFKKQASDGGGRGRYMAVVGIVWMTAFAVVAVFFRHATPTLPALLWGLAAGVLSAVANYLLILGMKKLDASVGATIYRLNMIPAALIALLFLGEPLSARKVLGLVVGVLAVLLFMSDKRDARLRPTAESALLIAIAASLLRALMGISYKLAASSFARPQVAAAGSQQEWFLAVQGLVWLAVGLFAALRIEPPASFSRRNASYGIVSGLLICGIVLFFAKALEIGEASIVIPISQMSFLVTALISLPVMKERFRARKVLGLCLATAAILLLSIT